MEDILAIKPELLRQLRLYRTQFGVSREPVVTRTDLDRVESELGVLLRPDVIAFLAMTGQHPDVVVELTETLREEGMRHRLAAIAVDGEGFHWCLHPEREQLVSYPAGEAAPDGMAAVVRRLRVQHAMKRGRSIATETDDPSVPSVTPREPATVRWVEHSRFGRGRLVREVEGAVEVEFDDGRRRRILADRVRKVA